MDRQSKIKKIANRSRKVSQVSNVEALETVLHEGYVIGKCPGVLTDTGSLEVIRIAPKSGVGECFRARWDQARDALDIDMLGASRNATRKFNAHRDGYSGHHTNRSTIPGKRIFEVTIKAQDVVIFDGTVSFSITVDQIIQAQVRISDAVSAEVIKGGGSSSLRIACSYQLTCTSFRICSN